MSQASRERQLTRAEETDNWEGIYNYQKGNRKKLPPRKFLDGRRGTFVNVKHDESKQIKT